MKLDWKMYFTILGLTALVMVAYEFNAFTFWKDDSDVVRIENASQASYQETDVPEDQKEEILDGEFTVINKNGNMRSADVVKNQKQEETGITPATISIPAIDVEAAVESVGILDNGQMGVPEDPQKAGWFEPGTEPGSTGNSVIAGHVDSRTGPAVFYDLDQLEKGDEITVSDENGEEKTYVVEKLESYPMDDSPIETIFGSSDEKRLNLITCTGEFLSSIGGHADRLVVYSKLKEPTQNQEDIQPPSNVQIQGTMITWHAVREDYVAGYRVYRSQDGETFEKVASISKHERKSYTDPEAADYSYYVTTVNEEGTESKPSNTAGKK